MVSILSSILFRCVLASLYEGLSVRPWVHPSVRPSVGPSVSIKEKTPKSTKIRGREGGDKGGGDKGRGECGDNAGDASDGRVSSLVYTDLGKQRNFSGLGN